LQIDPSSLDLDITHHLSGSYLYNIDPSEVLINGTTTSRILLPAAIPSQQPLVEIITLCVVTGCFVWIVRVLFDVARQPAKSGRSHNFKAD